MARQIGPFDGRFRRKRCSHCIKSHTKCDGKIPCSQCLFLGRVCCPAPAKVRQIQFKAPLSQAKYHIIDITSVPAALAPSWTDRCVAQFFKTFLRQHDFAGYSQYAGQCVQDLMHSSSCLFDAVLAVGALGVDIQGIKIGESGRRTAISHYNDAVVGLRTSLRNLSHIDELGHQQLWCSLLLGIFELLYDPTGCGFLVHFIQGTTVLLRRKNPADYLQSGGLEFVRFARMFELTRAVAFWNTSFLREPAWQVALDLIQDVDQDDSVVKDSSTFEEMVNLVEQITQLATDTVSITESTSPEDLTSGQIIELRDLARKGMQIRRCLELWNKNSPGPIPEVSLMTAKSVSPSSDLDSIEQVDEIVDHKALTGQPWPAESRIDQQLLLGQIYYHAVSCNLASTFKPYPHFQHLGLDVPSLSSEVIQKHITRILSLADCALQHTNLAGLLLLWPLRAAGARAVSTDQVSRVRAMFDEIKRRGFIVAQTYEDRCIEQWWIPKGLI